MKSSRNTNQNHGVKMRYFGMLILKDVKLWVYYVLSLDKHCHCFAFAKLSQPTARCSCRFKIQSLTKCGGNLVLMVTNINLSQHLCLLCDTLSKNKERAKKSASTQKAEFYRFLAPQWKRGVIKCYARDYWHKLMTWTNFHLSLISQQARLLIWF